jgi:hypothetical protein
MIAKPGPDCSVEVVGIRLLSPECIHMGRFIRGDSSKLNATEKHLFLPGARVFQPVLEQPDLSIYGNVTTDSAELWCTALKMPLPVHTWMSVLSF